MPSLPLFCHPAASILRRTALLYRSSIRFALPLRLCRQLLGQCHKPSHHDFVLAIDLSIRQGKKQLCARPIAAQNACQQCMRNCVAIVLQSLACRCIQTCSAAADLFCLGSSSSRLLHGRLLLSCQLHLSANPVPTFHGLAHCSAERERGQLLFGIAPRSRRIGPSGRACRCGFISCGGSPLQPFAAPPQFGECSVRLRCSSAAAISPPAASIAFSAALRQGQKNARAPGALGLSPRLRIRGSCPNKKIGEPLSLSTLTLVPR